MLPLSEQDTAIRYLASKQANVFYVQVDLCAEEMGNNVRPAVALLGDINAVMAQVTVDQLISLIATTVLSALLM